MEMEPLLLLLCLPHVAHAAEAAGREARLAGTVLPLRVQQLALAPTQQAPASRLRLRHDVSLTVPVAVGAPPQNVTMVLDTGSELSWLLCNGSSAPSAQPFNASASFTYGAVPCASPECRWRGRDLPVPPFCAAPPSNSCAVSLAYADASSADGVLAADTFLLGGGSPPVPALFGCVTSYSPATNSSEAQAATATGLLGMNRGSLSFVTQTATRRFAYCIAPGDGPGILVLGGDGVALAPPLELNYTPLIEISRPLPYFDRVAYSVQLEGIRVGSALLPIPESVLAPDHTGAGQTMVDSGTQFTFLLADAYAPLKAEFVNQTRALLAPLGEPDFVFQGAFDACFRAPEARVAAASQLLPEVALVLRGVEVAIAGEKLLYRVPGERRGESGADAVWCLTFGNSDMAGMSAYVIGHHHQQNVWVEYDLQNSRVGFAPARCDLATQRLVVDTGA
ncbi:hypothetical protein BS78_01G402900 [Paspalum vaginatum]|nr:hypothetical protein BS78_01G402900 [Paspalum vaginatum]